MQSNLRLLYTSNAFWSSSGYGVQGRALLPRLAELPEIGGRENIAQFAWYGLQGGVHHVDGFKIYPAGADPYGNDIIEAHTKDFQANIVISLIDVWVMKDTARKIAPALWCVTGDTTVTLNDNHQMPIKDLCEMKGNRRVALGHNGTQAVEGLITGYHYMGIKPTVEIETVTGRKLRTTAESGVYVDRDGHSEWIPVSGVIPGDMVYCIAGNHNSPGENDDELGTRTHDGMAVSDRHSGNGTGIFGGHLRWRGRDQHSRAHETPSVSRAHRGAVQDTATNGNGIQLQSGADRLVAQSYRLSGEQSRPAQGTHELSGCAIGLQELQPAYTATAISNCQEATGRIGVGVHSDSGRTFGHGTQSDIWAAGSGNLANTPRVELEEVRSVHSTGILEPVYDLTTSTHNFFANGLLIHNCPWLPIDHDPVPDVVLESLQGAHLPLTYSKWGHALLTAAGVENVYIPHGVEPQVFHVNADKEAVAEFKRNLVNGADCEHLTVMVAANKGFPDRKFFQGQVRAWADFAKDKPKARLYIHTEPTTMYGGIDFRALLTALGIGDKVFFPNRYSYHLGYPAEYLAMVYNAADAFMGAAMAEGFGIPLIEAQACGVPVITSDFSSMPELVRWGYKIAPADLYWTPLNSWQCWPDTKGVYEALETLYAAWHDNGGEWAMRDRLRASQAIHDEYSWDSSVRDQWTPLMARLAGEVPTAAPPEGVSKPQAARRSKLEPVGL